MPSHSSHLRFSLRTLLALIAVCAIALGGYVLSHRDPVAKVFGGRRGVNVVSHPTKVEAYRLGDLPENIAIDDSHTSDYPIALGPVELSAEAAKALSAAIFAQDFTNFGVPTACGFPVYGVKFTFVQDSHHVDVFVCFKCDFLAVVNDGARAGGEHFGQARPALVRVAKECFPDDAVIQSLDARD